MPWVLLSADTVSRGETVYNIQQITKPKDYIIRRASSPGGDNSLWGIWRLGLFVNVSGVAGQAFWTDVDQVDLYGRQHIYRVPTGSSIIQTAVFLPGRSPFPSVNFEVWRFD